MKTIDNLDRTIYVGFLIEMLFSLKVLHSRELCTFNTYAPKSTGDCPKCGWMLERCVCLHNEAVDKILDYLDAESEAQS